MVIAVSNLRVNNKAASSAVKITAPFPTLTWEYELIDRVDTSDTTLGVIDSVYKAEPKGFEIRIGTSSTNFGTTAFVGNLVNTAFVDNKTLQYRYKGSTLQRGETYYGQIRITDSEDNTSSWKTFVLSYNELPTITSATITPSNPNIHDDLLLSYTWTDTDGDVESGSKIWWFRNGVHERQFDGKTLIESKYVNYSDEWSAQIFPSDGHEYGKPFVTLAVTIDAEVPVVDNVFITPEAPTYNDPLYAKYAFTSVDGKADKSEIEWYVNGDLQAGKDKQFARLNLEEGDEVHFRVKPNDGELSGSWVSSPSVTISAPAFAVTDLRCNGETESLAATLAPTISWGTSGSRDPHSKVKVVIGTAPGSNNIYDSGVLDSSQLVFIVPEGVLERGRDYYVSVAAGDNDGVDEFSTIHIRTVGSRWQENVSNSRGWTIETSLKVLSTAIPAAQTSSSSSSSSVSSTYHGIRVYDGTKYAEIRIYTDRISLTSGSTVEYKSDATEYATYTIIGKGSNIKVFKNYVLVIDGTGLFTSPTTNKVLEFGAIGNSPNTLGQYLGFTYTTENAYDPSDSERYFDTQFETFIKTDGSVDYITGDGTDIYYAVSDPDTADSATVYKLSDNVAPTLALPSRDATINMNAIQASPNGDFTYFCHDNGVTVFRSKVIPQVDSIVNGDPVQGGWKLTRDIGSNYSVSGGINITTNGGKLFFSHSEKGSPWFDLVDNRDGWTVAFSLRVNEVGDGNAATIADKPEGFGIYVNDGRFQEVIHFFEDQIAIRNAGTFVSFDATALTEYVLVGKERTLKLFYKGSDGKYRLLSESSLVKPATAEANGGRPSVVEANGKVHATWHDDGGTYRSIYYAVNESGKWSLPVKITTEAYDCSNPTIAVDNNGTVYVAFESLRSDSTDISMVVKNAFGWSKTFLLDSGQYYSYAPKLAIDGNGNLHLAWEDHRDIIGSIMYRTQSATNGKWSDAVRVTDVTIDAVRPSIATDDDRVYIAFTDKANDGSTNVKATTKLVGNASWDVPVQVSSGGNNADFSDVVADDGVAYVTWHDNKSGSYEIYARRMTPSLGFVETPQQLTSHTYPCRFPTIGIRQGSDANTGNVYVAFETGGDLDYTSGWTDADYTISVVYFRQSIGFWLGSNQTHTVGLTTYGGSDVVLTPDDIRQSHRPCIAKSFAGNAHILYENEFGTEDDEYLAYSDKFTNIQDASFNLTYAPTYSLADSTIDLKVSGRLERKEVRFGDFADSYSGSMTFGYVKYLATEAVDPFDATLLIEGSQVNAASVNNSGDGWLAAQDGLNFYFNEDNRLATFDQGLFASGPVTDVAFDANNIMYVVAAGRIYISHDHLNFYQAFTYVTNAKSIAFDGDNFLWVASDSGAYKINVWATTSGLSREGVGIPQPPTSTTSGTSSSSSSAAPTGQSAGNEIKSTLTKDKTYYAFVLDPSLKAWNNQTKAFEISTQAHWSQYAIPLSQLGIPGTYAANFPTAITSPAIYYTYIYLQNGGQTGNVTAASPTPADTLVQQGEIDWDGTKERGYVPPTNTGGGTTVTPTPSTDVQCVEDAILGYTSFSTACGMPTNAARKVYVDSRNQVWLATAKGLVLISGKRLTVFSTENSGIPSDDVRDIAIVNSSVRYIATTSGLARMHGGGFERISFNDGDWSEDITAIAWRSPNTLWIGSGGKIIQLAKDTISGVYSFISFPASEYANYSTVCKNSQRFSFPSLDTSYLLQVLVNNRVVQNGYRISGTTLVFDSPLLDSDKVSIAVRKDIQKWVTLRQNKAEQMAYGNVFRTMPKFVVNGNNTYGLTGGDKQQIVSFDSSVTHKLPYDSIVFDSTPPVGELEFVEQLDGSHVKLRVINASDNLSGIKEMKVSNHPNLTSDGETAQPWVPFKEEIEFDLGDDLGTIFTQLELTDTDGRRLCSFKDTIYAGTANPARVYAYNKTLKAWQLAASIETNATIEFMIEYKNAFYIGTRNDNGGKLWSSSNGVDWKKEIDYPGKVYAATTLNNLLYVGTDGEDGGQLFTFDGVNSARIANKVGAAIYALHGANNSVYIGTGEAGILYRWDITTNRLILVVHDRDTEITAIGSALINPATATTTNPDPDFYLFAGTGTKGRIIKSINNAPFNISLTSVPTKVTQLKTDGLGQMHAIIGRNVYKYKNRSWTALYTNNFEVQDIYFDQDGYTIIYAEGIKRINNEKGTKKIYLGLRDVAGNESSNESIAVSIDINDLVGFVNTNRILELNEYGERVWSYEGDEPFYSAEKVVVEEAEYYSEVFNGTSDHVTWDSIYWDAVVPEDTDLKVSVRTAASRDELLTTKFSKTFSKDEFEGGDISNLSGQFIQFKVSLSTSVRGKSPKLYRINIRSRTRTAVHFFTTNFVLPSKVKGGLLTAQTFIPYAADVVFGINTNDSKDFHDYQVINPNQLFTMDTAQNGKNLRIGIKLISPLNVKLVTDDLEDEYSAYYGDLWTNVIPFEFTNTSGSAKTYFFKVELFENADMTGEAFSTIFTGTTPTAFAVDGVLADQFGTHIANGETVSVLAALKGNATIRCNEYYYAKVSAITGTTTTVIDDSHVFRANCSVNYDNDVALDFTNETGASHNFHFRAMFYADATRTAHVKTYFSGLDQTGWTVGGTAIPSGGKTIASGQTVSVGFTPPQGDLTEDNYFLSIDYYDGSDFFNITKSPTIAVTSDSEYSCGEYTNVPIVKDVGIEIQLDEFTDSFGGTKRTRRTIQFNI